MKRNASSLWAWPASIAAVSALGLLAALLGDGPWDALSAAALGFPVAVALYFSMRKPAASRCRRQR
jgi:hypothetical protein